MSALTSSWCPDWPKTSGPSLPSPGLPGELASLARNIGCCCCRPETPLREPAAESCCALALEPSAAQAVGMELLCAAGVEVPVSTAGDCAATASSSKSSSSSDMYSKSSLDGSGPECRILEGIPARDSTFAFGEGLRLLDCGLGSGLRESRGIPTEFRRFVGSPSSVIDCLTPFGCSFKRSL